MLNKVQFIGHIGQDIEERFLPNGNQVANFSVASTRKWTNKGTGEKQEAVEWLRVAAFDRLAEVVCQFAGKGSKVYVEGRLQTRKWEDNNGVEKFTTECVLENLVLLDGKPSGDDQQRNPQQRQAEPRREQARQQSPQANQPNSYAAGRGQAQPKPQAQSGGAQKTGTSFDDMPNDLDEDPIPF